MFDECVGREPVETMTDDAAERKGIAKWRVIVCLMFFGEWEGGGWRGVKDNRDPLMHTGFSRPQLDDSALWRLGPWQYKRALSP